MFNGQKLMGRLIYCNDAVYVGLLCAHGEKKTKQNKFDGNAMHENSFL